MKDTTGLRTTVLDNVYCTTVCIYCAIVNLRYYTSRTLPFTFSAAMLETVPYLLQAVQVNVPESSGKTSAITKVHISSWVYRKEKHTHILDVCHLAVSIEGQRI